MYPDQKNGAKLMATENQRDLAEHLVGEMRASFDQRDAAAALSLLEATGPSAREVNTAAMLAIGCTSGAGFAANAYRGGGFSDWYLPSEIEVFIANNLLFQYKNVSTEIKPVTWSSTTWWTSTQTSNFNSTASTVKIDSAVLVNSALGKASSAEVHPIRTF